MKYLLLIPAAIIARLLIALVRTLLTPKKASTYTAPADDDRSMMLAEKLAEMVRCDTTSYQDMTERAPFEAFHKVLEAQFPLVHQKLERTVLDGNLLYYWKGQSREKPILLMSHQDVVPAEGEWSYPPFSGQIAEGKVWGRGTSDTKASLMAFFQAAEDLLAQDYIPACDVYLASSCT